MSNANEETAAGKKVVTESYYGGDGTKYLLDRSETETIIFCHETGVAVPNEIMEQMVAALSGKAAADARVAELEELVRHCWVHSGYQDCGHRQMTTEQKALYAQVIERDPDDANANSPTPPRQI